MIAPLRRRHRILFIALAAVLPALLAAAWLQKPTLPSSGLPVELLASADGAELASGDAGFADHRAQLRRFERSIELTLETPLRAPDVLAYLSQADSSGDGLPADAKLLGAVHPNRANVYALHASDSGELLLYSLGHQVLLDRAPVAALRAPAPAPEPTAAVAGGAGAPETGETEGGAE